MNNGLVNHTEAEGTVRGPRSEVRGLMIILIMKKGKGRGLRRDPRPRSPPRSESESCNKRTTAIELDDYLPRCPPSTVVASCTIFVRCSIVYFSSGVSVHSHRPCAARTRLLTPQAAAAELPPRRNAMPVMRLTSNDAGSHRRRTHSRTMACNSAVTAPLPHGRFDTAALRWPASCGKSGPHVSQRSLGHCALEHAAERFTPLPARCAGNRLATLLLTRPFSHSVAYLFFCDAVLLLRREPARCAGNWLPKRALPAGWIGGLH
jgi:hypothetical protein